MKTQREKNKKVLNYGIQQSIAGSKERAYKFIIASLAIILVVETLYLLISIFNFQTMTACEGALKIGRVSYIQESCKPGYDHWVDLETGKRIKLK